MKWSSLLALDEQAGLYQLILGPRCSSNPQTYVRMLSVLKTSCVYIFPAKPSLELKMHRLDQV